MLSLIERTGHLFGLAEQSPDRVNAFRGNRREQFINLLPNARGTARPDASGETWRSPSEARQQRGPCCFTDRPDWVRPPWRTLSRRRDGSTHCHIRARHQAPLEGDTEESLLNLGRAFSSWSEIHQMPRAKVEEF